jgi:hypothetical protein
MASTQIDAVSPCHPRDSVYYCGADCGPRESDQPPHDRDRTVCETSSGLKATRFMAVVARPGSLLNCPVITLEVIINGAIGFDHGAMIIIRPVGSRFIGSSATGTGEGQPASEMCTAPR